jgi:uncharacterized protein (DUF1800 family)
MCDDSAAMAPAASSPAAQSASVPQRSTRRGLLSAFGAMALSGLAARPARAVGPSGSAADIDPSAVILKLVNRITFGYTSAEYTRAAQLGYTAYLEEQLNMTAADEDPALVSRLATLTTLWMTGEQLYALNNTGQQRNELTDAAILRAIYSKRQLYERMVEFWTDHFSININTDQAPFLKTLDDRLVIRQYAMTSFPQLLFASAQSPAMLNYLDNDINTKNGINENYGREVLELHTMGVNSGYTQSDVINVAKALTGWGRWNSTANPSSLRGTFRYNDNNHDKTQKVILGRTYAANRGIEDGNEFLAQVAADPRTAAYIAKKLCKRFLGEEVRQGIIDQVAATYMATSGDIKSMLRVVLTPSNLHESAPRYKRPFHLAVSALRVLPMSITSLSSLRTRLNNAGHAPFQWDTPDGYPDTFAYWSGLILPRWNFASTVAPGSASNILVDTASLFAGMTTAQQIVDRLDFVFFAGLWPAAEKNRVRTYLGTGNPSMSARSEAIGLAACSPAFQWY